MAWNEGEEKLVSVSPVYRLMGGIGPGGKSAKTTEPFKLEERAVQLLGAHDALPGNWPCCRAIDSLRLDSNLSPRDLTHFQKKRANCVKVGIRNMAVPDRLKIERSSMKRESVIVSDPEILGGTPCFRGTRVPVDSLIDYFEAGDTLDEFLDNFPSVSREAAIAALEEAKAVLTGPR